MYKHYSRSVFFALLLTSICLSQAPDTSWLRLYGGDGIEKAYQVIKTRDNCFVISGYSQSFGNGCNDIYVIKTDANGDTIWTNTYGTPRNEMGYDIIQTYDDGFVVVGESYSEDYDQDIIILKIDENGDSLWAKVYSWPDNDEARAVVETFEGGLAIAGNSGSLGNGREDIIFLRTDEFGDTLWTRTYGGAGYDNGYDLEYIDDEGFIIAGYTGSFDDPAYDIYLIRIDLNGDTLWTKTYGTYFNLESAHSVEMTYDGGFIIGGNAFGFGNSGYHMIRTNSYGDSIWACTYSFSYPGISYGAMQTPDSGFVIVGYTITSQGDDIFAVKTKPNGDTVWTKTVGGQSDDYACDVIITEDDEYIITGTTTSFGALSQDICLINLTFGQVYIDKYNEPIPCQISLSQNYPNPFNASTTISYTLPHPSDVTLNIYDILGRKVLYDGKQTAGKHSIIWNADGFSSGVYFYKIQTGDNVETKKMVLLK